MIDPTPLMTALPKNGVLALVGFGILSAAGVIVAVVERPSETEKFCENVAEIIKDESPSPLFTDKQKVEIAGAIVTGFRQCAPKVMTR